LLQTGVLDNDATVICNGFKTDEYIDRIVRLKELGKSALFAALVSVEPLLGLHRLLSDAESD